MKNKKTFLSIILVLIFILVLIIIFIQQLNISLKQGENKDDTELNDKQGYIFFENDEIMQETTIAVYYKIFDCINKNREEYFLPTEIYSISGSQGGVYITKGTMQNNEIYYRILFDYQNYTYKVEDIAESDYNMILNGDIDDKYLKEQNIENNGNNTFELANTNENKLSTLYFNIIKNMYLYQPEKLYDILDEKYREIRFSDFSEFKYYINTKKSIIENMEMTKYQKKTYDDYYQYICVDNYNNHYIINVSMASALKYSIMLDTYTVELPQFIEKYEQASVETKVRLNVNRFISGINDRNYNFVYSILADSFKNNNYPNIDIFANYIDKNLPDNYTIEFGEITAQENIYVCKAKLINKDLTSEKNVTVIMRLENGTGFEMSFNLD